VDSDAEDEDPYDPTDETDWMYPDEDFVYKYFPTIYPENPKLTAEDNLITPAERAIALNTPNGFRAHIISALRGLDVLTDSQAIFAAFRQRRIPSNTCHKC
jgi:hypothetical protein